jgi:hypothetical protein
MNLNALFSSLFFCFILERIGCLGASTRHNSSTTTAHAYAAKGLAHGGSFREKTFVGQ